MDWSEAFASCAKWPELRVMGWKKLVRHPEASMNFRRLLRGLAQPNTLHTITLTKDLLWAISKLSIELDPEYLLQQAVNARMPFEVLIIEWNILDREEIYNELRVAQDRLGDVAGEVPSFLVVTDGDSKTINNLSYAAKDKKLCWFPCVAETNSKYPAKESELLKTYMKASGTNFTVADWLFTSNILKKYPGSDVLSEDPRVQVRLAGPLFVAAVEGEPHGEKFKTLMSGTAGQFRWFGALCALLNRQGLTRYVDAAPPTEPVPGRAQARDSAKPRTQVLTLMLPRDKVVQRVVRAMEHERKKVGLHEVMGHWAYSHRKGEATCAHDWPQQPTRRQVCGTCGAVRWWKTPHNRGEGDTLKAKARRADFSGVAVDRLVEQIKLESGKGTT